MAMASDAALRAMDLANPCCALWKTKCSKMEEKRNALRQGVEILKGQIDRLQQENLNLKKAYDEERARANVNEKEKGKEASLRISMEKEIAALKSEISSTRCELVSGNEDLNKEVTLLRACLPEKHMEIDNLKRLLVEKGRRADAEKEQADLEKKKAAELQKALEHEKIRADEAKKMADSMEKEIAALKSEVSYSGHEVDSGTEDLNKEVTHLQARVSERELEIERLKQLLTEEERKVDAERQRADLEKRSTVELQEALAFQKSRANEASKMADAAGKKAEENRLQLENLKTEVDKTRLKCEEAKKKLEAEKQKARKEKKCADEVEARVIEHRKIAESNEKQMVEEKSRANNLLRQLEDKQQLVVRLQKELQEVRLSQKSAYSCELDEVKRNFEAEKKKYAREKKRADDEMSEREAQKKVAAARIKKIIEESHRADKLAQELQSSRQRVEYLEKELCEVNNMLDGERKKASSEKMRADAEKLKSDEQEKVAAENGRIAAEEKLRADNLRRELENNWKRLQDMVNELEELRSYGKLGETSNIPPVVVTEQTSELQFLRKQLKFEKQRVKHAKEVAELEKDRNIILQEELFRVRKSVKCLLHQLDVLTNIGAKTGANNLSKSVYACLQKSGLSDVHAGLLTRRILPSHMYISSDAELRLSSLSSRDASCHYEEKEGYVPTGHRSESPSASFSDEQLVGSQERVAHSLNTSAVLAQENTNLQATILKCSDEFHTCKYGEKVGIVAENSVRSPVKATARHAIKKRKILDELESIKSMQSEGQKLFEETKKKLSALHSTLFQSMNGHGEKENYQFPFHIVDSSNYDQSIKKRKASHEPEAACLPIDDSGLQAEMEKHEVALAASKGTENFLFDDSGLQAEMEKHEVALAASKGTEKSLFDSGLQSEMEKHEVALAASKGTENSLVLEDASRDMLKCNRDVAKFEELMNGDYMKLLNLDNDVDEECFRMAMEMPLSPTLPEIKLPDSEARIDAQMLSVHASNSLEPDDQHDFIQDQKQVYCIVFSDIKDSSTINRIFCAVRTCLAQCSMFLHTSWLVHDLLAALSLEKDLRPREKVCALFSLILLNLSGASRKLEELQNKDLLNSFFAHIRSVLCSGATRSRFAKMCHISDLLALFEDFVHCRLILLHNNAASGSLLDSSSSFEVLHEGKTFVLSAVVASIDLVVAGSIVLASICAATGRIGYLCEVSFNILQMCVTEDRMMLRILHMFAHVCGQEYFSSSNYGFMEVVKSVTTFVECAPANMAGSGNVSEPCFVPCVRCPFSEGSFSLDDVSAMLLGELQKYYSGSSASLDPVGHVHLSTTEPHFFNWADVLSSLELIALMMGWKWACNKIVPKLLKMLESCDQGKDPATALVALLGELGRLGVKEWGYDDVGVESIKCQLSNILCHGGVKMCNAFSMAVVSALVGLHPKGHEEVFSTNVDVPSKNGGHSASATSEILRKCLFVDQ